MSTSYSYHSLLTHSRVLLVLLEIQVSEANLVRWAHLGKEGLLVTLDDEVLKERMDRRVLVDHQALSVTKVFPDRVELRAKRVISVRKAPSVQLVHPESLDLPALKVCRDFLVPRDQKVLKGPKVKQVTQDHPDLPDKTECT